MKAVVQRARNASVVVEGRIAGKISRGLLVYLGVASGDGEKDAAWMAEKIANLRIFEDAQGKMNLSLKDILGQAGEGDVGVLAVSQFTLLADASKGRRPYYGGAANPEKAKALYGFFMEKIREQGLLCEAGVFQAHMDVSYTNDGPVTIILNS
ncbi:MAG: D-tyrosyl-tRNA(Tyr) deacylase [Treponema sp.]|jgi:D-tyrosyl-tRNA(Tyr) deacylase|nr:D-tyrosyl-tRNA(Tyr) deacylase [Treponema sp.]